MTDAQYAGQVRTAQWLAAELRLRDQQLTHCTRERDEERRDNRGDRLDDAARRALIEVDRLGVLLRRGRKTVSIADVVAAVTLEEVTR